MKLDGEDPRVTAYVLGELDDASARAEIEEAIETCSASRELVEDLRAFTEELGTGLAVEDLAEASKDADASLGSERRAALEARLEDAPSDKSDSVVDFAAAKKTRRRRWILGGSVAAAASVLVVLGLGSTMLMKGAPSMTAGEARPQWLTATKTESGSMGKMGQKSVRPSEQKNRYGLRAGRISIESAPRSSTIVVDGKHRIVVAGKGYLGKKVVLAAKTAKDANLISGRTDKPSPDPAASDDKDGEGRDKGIKGERKASGESYRALPENPFRSVAKAPLSTFSIDVDTASYSNMRRFLTRNMLPPPASVRIEELVNYFSYRYAPPAADEKTPFAVHVDIAPAPWNARHRLMRVGLKGRVIKAGKRPPSNLVFLLDVSGSMGSPNKLPLLRRALSLLVRRLGENDRVAIAVYAGASGLVLRSTACTPKNKARILSSLERLQAGGSTNGGAGIDLAYNIAVKNAINGGVNRVILATDGDFNVGPSSRAALLKLIKKKAKSNVFLTVLGFGMGNYKDSTLELLANKGNGNYAYIDTFSEARKVLVRQLSGTLVTIAKDVKIQVEMNPAKVAAYRLIGYENRMLAAKDFANDKKDAGEIGAGHTVTALYELVMKGTPLPTHGSASLRGSGLAPKLRYQRPTTPTAAARKELLIVKLRYKKPEGKKSTLVELPVSKDSVPLSRSSADFRHAASVAWFGMILRGSKHLPEGARKLSKVAALAEKGRGEDRHGYRKEFATLVGRAQKLRRGR